MAAVKFTRRSVIGLNRLAGGLEHAKMLPVTPNFRTEFLPLVEINPAETAAPPCYA